MFLLVVFGFDLRIYIVFYLSKLYNPICKKDDYFKIIVVLLRGLPKASEGKG